MRKNIANHEDGIASLITNGHINARTILADNRSVKRQRKREPLILLDAAIDMAIKVHKTALFIKRLRLKVKARRVRVAADNFKPRLGNRLLADDCGHDCAILVAAIDLVTGLKALKRRNLLKALGAQAANAFGIAKTLGLRCTEIIHIFLAVGFQLQILVFHTSQVYQNWKNSTMTKPKAEVVRLKPLFSDACIVYSHKCKRKNAVPNTAVGERPLLHLEI